ncbi:hypothetical protein [Chamaesiphon sp. OTE_20_metabat_361]|uniref:hypothetical protein n=1 Tax=Chamaesiphon sp. OTE_20_metabat_361 TaxID=2964689 RepID=UPI00286A24F2|nr:hypothetical protein [Chamaesiphon sp. OTE_20_metabat_361]
MKPSSMNPGVIALLCVTSLTIGSATPAVTVTPPPKTTPVKTVPNSTPQNRFLPPVQNSPPSKVTPANPATPPTAPAATTNNLPLVVVPNLTPVTIKSFTNLYAQLLAVKFTPNQQAKISQRLNREWVTNLGLRNTVTQTIALEPQIVRGTPVERTQLQTKIIANLRQQVLDGDGDALWLVSFYDAAPKNWLAPGKPPLTRMTSDMSAEVLCFMVNEVMGKSVATADTKLKNAIAAKLTAEYARIPIDTKQELSRLPTNWLAFKNGQWIRRGDYFREQMRIQWGQNLEAYIPEIKQISKLRRDRLARLQADPKIQWNKINSVQRQVVFQKSDLEFQTSLKTLPPVTTVQLTNYINNMQVANAIGNSPTRSSLRLKVK